MCLGMKYKKLMFEALFSIFIANNIDVLELKYSITNKIFSNFNYLWYGHLRIKILNKMY